MLVCKKNINTLSFPHHVFSFTFFQCSLCLEISLYPNLCSTKYLENVYTPLLSGTPCKKTACHTQLSIPGCAPIHGSTVSQQKQNAFHIQPNIIAFLYPYPWLSSTLYWGNYVNFIQGSALSQEKNTVPYAQLSTSGPLEMSLCLHTLLSSIQ